MSAANVRPEPPHREWLSDEPQMETIQHSEAMMAFITTLQWLWRDRTDYVVAGNLTVFYSPNQKKSEDVRGPDVFVALGVDGTRPRRGWVVWEEGGRYPNFILELLSDSTEHVDRGEKMQIYQDVFRTPEYFLFDPFTTELEGYRLVGGRYQRIAPDARGHLASDQLDLCLGVEGGKLRLFFRDGALVPTPVEAAAQAQGVAAQAQHAAAQAQHAAAQAQDAAAQAEHRADEAEQRAARAEAELAALRRRRD